MRPACSIIIRTLNEARYLGDLLVSIRTQSYPQGLIEVILVDSGSTDATLEIAARWGARIVKIRREEFSFGRSLNLGCTAAQGEFLVMISGHCVPTGPEWLWNLLRPFSDPHLAITYGRQEGGPETQYSEHALFRKYFPPTLETPIHPFFCNNANLALRRRCWAEFHFDEALTGLEDMHLARQLVQRQWVVRYVPEASVYHYHHERWRQIKRRYEREAIALREILPHVHVTTVDAVRYFFAGVLGDWSQALQEGCWTRVWTRVIAFRFCQFYGAWRGHRHHRALSAAEKERYFYP